MIGATVLDRSFDKGAPANDAAHGAEGWVFYVGPSDPGKDVAAATLQAAWQTGRSTAFVHELTVGHWRGGYPAGLETMRLARAKLSALGVSVDTPIHAPFDQWINPSDFALAADYQRGCNDGGASRASYAEGALLAYLADAHLIDYLWLSNSLSFPGTRGFARATLIQHYGLVLPGLAGSYDCNTVAAEDWGAYPRVHPVPPTPPLPDPPMEDTMDALYRGKSGTAVFHQSGAQVVHVEHMNTVYAMNAARLFQKLPLLVIVPVEDDAAQELAERAYGGVAPQGVLETKPASASASPKFSPEPPAGTTT